LTWFITGSTGFLGKEIINVILRETNDNLYLLVRDRREISAEGRLRELLGKAGNSHHAERVVLCEGDVTEEQFGLSPETWRNVARACTHILHLAATTRFDTPLDRARSINVNGVRTMLALADEASTSGQLERVGHVSTAYVAGAHRGTATPDTLLPDGPFRNNYEHSKTEAEVLVRARMGDLPISVFRPSVVVGSSKTGEFSGFSTVYPFIYAYLRGRNFVFGKRSAVLDIVPVDYVARAILHLMTETESKGVAYNIAGGERTAVTVGEFCRMMTKHLGGQYQCGFCPHNCSA